MCFTATLSVVELGARVCFGFFSLFLLFQFFGFSKNIKIVLYPHASCVCQKQQPESIRTNERTNEMNKAQKKVFKTWITLRDYFGSFRFDLNSRKTREDINERNHKTSISRHRRCFKNAQKQMNLKKNGKKPPLNIFSLVSHPKLIAFKQNNNISFFVLFCLVWFDWGRESVMKSTHSLVERTSRNGNTQHFLVSKERAPHTTVRRYTSSYSNNNNNVNTQHTKHKIQIHDYILRASAHTIAHVAPCMHTRVYILDVATRMCVCALCVCVWFQLNGSRWYESVCLCVGAIGMLFCVLAFTMVCRCWLNVQIGALDTHTHARLNVVPRFVVFGRCGMGSLCVVSSLLSPARAFLTHAAVYCVVVE